MPMYRKFVAMIAFSTIMMLPLMYLNTFSIDHVFFSETRAFMAVVMGATMSLIMLMFMRAMLTNTGLNVLIVSVAVATFGAALWLVRSQASVDDSAYMKAMIPHHSIAILTSERANIRDPRVRRLADGIIDAQQREIAEMKRLINELEADRRN